MADLTKHWQRQKAILTSAGDQARSVAFDELQQWNDAAHGNEDESSVEQTGDALQALIDGMCKSDRHSTRVIGMMAEAGLIACLVAELESKGF